MSSPIDKIFKEIFGYEPAKPGTAYEQLAAIATHLINGGEVRHDDKVRGEFSKTLYQLDVLHSDDNSTTMGEVKDYTIQKKKVGRGDLQKLGGALPDLPEIDRGAFFSATGFTRPAKKYAEAAEKILGKPITLWELRPSTVTDEQGYIKTIVLNMHFILPQPQEAKWLPHITPCGQEAMKALLKEGEHSLKYSLGLECFYDRSGNKIQTLEKLTSKNYGEINGDSEKSHACFYLPGHYIEINGVLAEIYGLEYEMPYVHDFREIRITDDSESRFVLLDKDGNIQSFMTDSMLKEYEFDGEGNLKKR